MVFMDFVLDFIGFFFSAADDSRAEFLPKRA